MYRLIWTLVAILALKIFGVGNGLAAENKNPTSETEPVIITLRPPAQDFFSKELVYDGIPIKANEVVSDAAMYEAYRRMNMLLRNLLVKQPTLISNLLESHVELHIIGVHQVTSDLPEFRDLKGKPLPEYNGLTIDQRTRGMGGQLSSCGEENLLNSKGITIMDGISVPMNLPMQSATTGCRWRWLRSLISNTNVR